MLGRLTHAQKADDPNIVLRVNCANRHFSDVTAALRVHRCGWWIPCISLHGTILLLIPCTESYNRVMHRVMHRVIA